MRGSESVGSDDTFIRGREFMTVSLSQAKVDKVSPFRVRAPITLYEES